MHDCIILNHIADSLIQIWSSIMVSKEDWIIYSRSEISIVEFLDIKKIRLDKSSFV
jgi:hypothetical protein